MFSLLVVLVFILTTINAYDSCETPDGKQGECVLISHCPPIFTTLFKNQTETVSKHQVRQSHCGFESILFPKICCPIGNVYRPSPTCGLHTPEGAQDPWITLIGYEKPDGSKVFTCGGVLIHKRYVLTAAHCVKFFSENAKLVTVRFGDYNADPPLDIQAENVIVHEDFEEQNRRNDIALIRLRKKVSFKNGEIRPICLPVNGGETVEGFLQLAGWEKSGNNTDNFIKRAGIAVVWNDYECYSWYKNTEIKLDEVHMCAGGKKKPYANKHGINVGGVLMSVAKDNSYSLVGISSLKLSCCQTEDHPSIYTKVAKYVNWIVGNLDS